jgi:hypothetical protein
MLTFCGPKSGDAPYVIPSGIIAGGLIGVFIVIGWSKRSNQSMKPTAPLRTTQRVCYDTPLWLISFSLGKAARSPAMSI